MLWDDVSQLTVKQQKRRTCTALHPVLLLQFKPTTCSENQTILQSIKQVLGKEELKPNNLSEANKNAYSSKQLSIMIVLFINLPRIAFSFTLQCFWDVRPTADVTIVWQQPLYVN